MTHEDAPTGTRGQCGASERSPSEPCTTVRTPMAEESELGAESMPSIAIAAGISMLVEHIDAQTPSTQKREKAASAKNAASVRKRVLMRRNVAVFGDADNLSNSDSRRGRQGRAGSAHLPRGVDVPMVVAQVLDLVDGDGERLRGGVSSRSRKTVRQVGWSSGWMRFPDHSAKAVRRTARCCVGVVAPAVK